MIAFDASSHATSGSTQVTSLTWSHTVTGSNPVLLVGAVSTLRSISVVTGITYSGIAMTLVRSTPEANSNTALDTYGLINPPVGTANIVISMSFAEAVVGVGGSYTGCMQSSQPANDAFTKTTGNGGSSLSNTGAVNVTYTNCWVVGFGLGGLAGNPASVQTTSNKTARGQDFQSNGGGAQGDLISFDSNGIVTGGIYNATVSSNFNAFAAGQDLLVLKATDSVLINSGGFLLAYMTQPR